MITFTLGADGPALLKKSFIDLVIKPEGEIVSQTGGTVANGAVIFRIPLLRLLVLDKPLDYSVDLEVGALTRRLSPSPPRRAARRSPALRVHVQKHGQQDQGARGRQDQRQRDQHAEVGDRSEGREHEHEQRGHDREGGEEHGPAGDLQRVLDRLLRVARADRATAGGTGW